MKETKLKFQFHNFNSETVTAKIFLEAVIQANQHNIEAMLVHNLSSQEIHKTSKKTTAVLSASV